MRAAGVVLVGGRSSRMGAEKAALAWHGSTLLRRTVGILGRVVAEPVIVVGAPGQVLPALDVPTESRTDPVPGRGPLQGIAVGLAAAAARADAAFVCSVDLPLLHPDFVRAVLAALEDGRPGDGEADVALPHVGGHRQPLLAAYRTSLAPLAEALLADGERTPGALLARCRVRELDADALRRFRPLAERDPDLLSVTNVNAPADYAAARRMPAPLVRVERAGSAPRSVRAATVGAALVAAGLAPSDVAGAVIDGRTATSLAEEPLAAGDRVVVTERTVQPT